MSIGNKRYYVDTEHVRGERRIYWVNDSRQHSVRWNRGVAVTDYTTDKRKAERQCDKLNDAASAPSRAGEG